MFTSNLVAASCHKAYDLIMTQRMNKANKYQYHVTSNDAIGTIEERFTQLPTENNPAKVLKRINGILLLLAKHAPPLAQINPFPEMIALE